MSTERLTLDTTDNPDNRSRTRRFLDTLQDTLRQRAETVTRKATFGLTGGNVEDVDPPEDIDEFVDLYYDVGAIRKNINEFVDDVTAPGIRVEVDEELNNNPDQTRDYFMGGNAAPDGAPKNGFLSECFVFDERRQPFGKGLEISVRDRWVRGTVMVEYVKDEPEDPESLISGFKFIRPETISARTYPYTTRLIDPEDTENADMLTPRGEAAAYVQFDEQAILARRLQRSDDNRFRESPFPDTETSRPLSQNDVLKLVLDQDIGGSDPETGVYGESIIRAIKDTAEEYRNIKRNLTKAVQGKAWGIWTLQMNDYVLDAGNDQIMVEWPDGDIDDVTSEAEDLGPGSLLSTDAKINLERHDGDVPDLEWVLRHYTRDIIDPLPAPFYKHSQADEINQFVTNEQQEDYQERIRAERRYQAEQWTRAFRLVAERHPDLDPSGVKAVVEPEQDESPVLSLDNDTIERISTLATAMRDLYGPGGAPSFVSEQVLNELILQLPEDAGIDAEDVEDMGVDELSQELRALGND